MKLTASATQANSEEIGFRVTDANGNRMGYVTLFIGQGVDCIIDSEVMLGGIPRERLAGKMVYGLTQRFIEIGEQAATAAPFEFEVI